MSPISRRSMITTAAGGLLTATTAAKAQTGEETPQPRRAAHGGSDPGPRKLMRDRQNPSCPALDRPRYAAQPTFPFLRLTCAASDGWLDAASDGTRARHLHIAGVTMRLNAGGVRELHRHKGAEWAYMLYGNARITAIDAEGRNFVDDAGVGDLWYFASGVPHSIQGLNSDGAEFLLVFDDGDFDEDNTFLISDGFKHTPNDVLAKNFGVSTASVRITDSSVFPASKNIAAALVEVEPGGMREMPGHLNHDASGQWDKTYSGDLQERLVRGAGERTAALGVGDGGSWHTLAHPKTLLAPHPVAHSTKIST